MKNAPVVVLGYNENLEMEGWLRKAATAPFSTRPAPAETIDCARQIGFNEFIKHKAMRRVMKEALAAEKQLILFLQCSNTKGIR